MFIQGIAIQGNLFSYDIKTIGIYTNTLQAIAAGNVIPSNFLLSNIAILSTIKFLIGCREFSYGAVTDIRFENFLVRANYPWISRCGELVQ